MNWFIFIEDKDQWSTPWSIQTFQKSPMHIMMMTIMKIILDLTHNILNFFFLHMFASLISFKNKFDVQKGTHNYSPMNTMNVFLYQLSLIPIARYMFTDVIPLQSDTQLRLRYKILRTENHDFETRIWNTVLQKSVYKSFLRSVFLALCLSQTVPLLRISFCAACPLGKGQTGCGLFDLDHCDVI